MMGHEYMQLHSIGYGPSVQLEDAKTALKAYWAMAEKRFHANSAAAIEQVLLLKGSQQIERQLLELINSGFSIGAVDMRGSFGSMMMSAAATTNGRNEDTNDIFNGSLEGLTLADIMAEDPQISAERSALTEKKLVLEKAIKRMETVSHSSSFR